MPEKQRFRFLFLGKGPAFAANGLPNGIKRAPVGAPRRCRCGEALGASVRGFFNSGLPGPKGNIETFVALAEGPRGSVADLAALALEADGG